MVLGVSEILGIASFAFAVLGSIVGIVVWIFRENGKLYDFINKTKDKNSESVSKLHERMNQLERNYVSKEELDRILPFVSKNK